MLLAQPPCSLVIFSSARSLEHEQDYLQHSNEMTELVSQQPGFISSCSARANNRLGITLSFWQDESAIASWGTHPRHQHVQRLGARLYYTRFATHRCEVITCFDNRIAPTLKQNGALESSDDSSFFAIPEQIHAQTVIVIIALCSFDLSFQQSLIATQHQTACCGYQLIEDSAQTCSIATSYWLNDLSAKAWLAKQQQFIQKQQVIVYFSTLTKGFISKQK